MRIAANHDAIRLHRMPGPKPTYTAERCRAAYQLNWSLSVFWRQAAPPAGRWLDALQESTERDGVRILEHQLSRDNVSQFVLSTTPTVAPCSAVRSIKGRLQHLIHAEQPAAFRRNYAIHSTGSANAEAIEQYIAGQIEHHPMADSRIQERLRRFQFHDESVDLSIVRNSAHGQFLHNLHVVMVYRDRGVDVREAWLSTTSDTLRQTARKKGHLLSHVSPVADHIHFAVGCDIAEAPQDVVLSYMNNLAYMQGGARVFENSYYVGTFGRYDLNATRA
jgi:REP element-mobilizing transposase RayT